MIGHVFRSHPHTVNLHDFHQLVRKRLLVLALQVFETVRGLRERNAAACLHRSHHAVPLLATGIEHDLGAIGQRRIRVIRAGSHVEHIGCKRICPRIVRVRFRANRGPLLGSSIVFVREFRYCRCLARQHASIVLQLLHGTFHRQVTIVLLVFNHHGDLVQRIRCAYAWQQPAIGRALVNLIHVRTWLRVGDVSEAERHRGASWRALGLCNLHARHAAA